jgi:kynurenine formamidase
MDVVASNLGRRNFLRAGLGGATLSLSSCAPLEPARHGDGGTPPKPGFPSFDRVVDLTHIYSNRFTHWSGGTARVELETLFSTANGDGWNVTRWTLDEHAGTHIDSPFHRNPEGLTVDKIPARDLVLPLAIIDIRAKAEENEDAQVTLDDLKAWEEKNGRLPERCCVAMLSGWDSRVEKPGFINFDDKGVRHFPGFHTEAAVFLLEERNVLSMGVDTASLDYGPTENFPVHTAWLGSGRWGIENLANLAELPPRGATLVCGAPKIEGATGGHSRILALL